MRRRCATRSQTSSSSGARYWIVTAGPISSRSMAAKYAAWTAASPATPRKASDGQLAALDPQQVGPREPEHDEQDQPGSERPQLGQLERADPVVQEVARQAPVQRPHGGGRGRQRIAASGMSLALARAHRTSRSKAIGPGQLVEREAPLGDVAAAEHPVAAERRAARPGATSALRVTARRSAPAALDRVEHEPDRLVAVQRLGSRRPGGGAAAGRRAGRRPPGGPAAATATRSGPGRPAPPPRRARRRPTPARRAARGASAASSAAKVEPAVPL